MLASLLAASPFEFHAYLRLLPKRNAGAFHAFFPRPSMARLLHGTQTSVRMGAQTAYEWV